MYNIFTEDVQNTRVNICRNSGGQGVTTTERHFTASLFKGIYLVPVWFFLNVVLLKTIFLKVCDDLKVTVQSENLRNYLCLCIHEIEK